MRAVGVKTRLPAAVEPNAGARRPLPQEPVRAEPRRKRPWLQKLIGERTLEGEMTIENGMKSRPPVAGGASGVKAILDVPGSPLDAHWGVDSVTRTPFRGLAFNWRSHTPWSRSNLLRIDSPRYAAGS